MMSTDKAEMRNFEKWAKDKNPLFAEIALIIATSAKDCCELLEELKVGKRIEGDVQTKKGATMN